MSNSQVKELSLTDIFVNLKEYYIIPPYQRNYAWGAKEIEQLIQDIIDQSRQGTASKNYYIGTLVTYQRSDSKFEVIDGQQRLTTLTLLIKALEQLSSSDKNQDSLTNARLILEFDSRKKSTEAIESIWRGNHDTGCSLGDGYNICKQLLSEKLEKLGKSDKQENDSTKNSNSIRVFTEFLLNNVKIIRVIVPKDTDLNHYFEIMNNRGEQLEKHEILKANFMSCLSEQDRITFAKIWDACANMDKYVQYGFNPTERYNIFSDSCDKFEADEFDDIKKNIVTINNGAEGNTLDSEKDLNYILNNKPNQVKIDNKEDSERFSSIIDFPNFLLHVLRIFVNTPNKFNNSSKKFKDIPLDDKRLLESFGTIFDKPEDQDLIKYFAYELLRCKFLFDKYIIKREISKGIAGWELQTLVRSTDNKKSIYYKNTFDNVTTNNVTTIQADIITLQAMFHVSTPSSNYKYWLDGALFHLMVQENNKIETNYYRDYLKKLARRFVYDRYLSSEPQEYYAIIYGENNMQIFNRSICEERLKYGEIRNNLVFNYLDYLLWFNQIDDIFPNDMDLEKRYSKENYEAAKKNFVFTFRSSVEHYYPQNPKEETVEKVIDTPHLHCFGNLCLVTHEQNSSLSNNDTNAKKGRYFAKHVSDKKPDSMKQYLMMSYREWNPDSITDHHVKMINILKTDAGIYLAE